MSGERKRRSIRLPEYDYSQPGAYFVTISSHQKRDMFGSLTADQVRLNEFGLIAQRNWQAIPEHFSFVSLDTYIVMPDHVHGILFIRDHSVETAVGARHATQPRVGAQHAAPLHPSVNPGSLGAIVRSYKSAVTREINQLRETSAVPVWQRNYYERVIRNQRELDSLRNYVEYNFLKPSK